MPTKAELLASLSSKGIPHDASMKKDELERREKASQYKPSVMTREDIEKLTVPILKEILSIHGKSTKGLAKKEDIVKAVVQLNSTLEQEEEQHQVETTEKFKKIPVDALRLAMKRLTLPEQMKASIAFSEKELVQELQTKRLDVPFKLTIYADNQYERVVSIQRFTEMTKEQIKNYLYPLLREKKTWTLENDYLVVKRIFLYDDSYRFIIEPKNSPISILITHIISLKDKTIHNIKYYITLNTLDKDIIQPILNYVRIGIRWIELYVGYTVVSKNQTKEPLDIILILDNIPNVYNDTTTTERIKYLKMITNEIKKVIKKK